MPSICDAPHRYLTPALRHPENTDRALRSIDWSALDTFLSGETLNKSQYVYPGLDQVYTRLQREGKVRATRSAVPCAIKYEVSRHG